MDRWPLLCFAILNLFTSYLRVHSWINFCRICLTLAVSLPKTCEGWLIECFLFDEFSDKLFDAGDVCECCISHQDEKMFLLFLKTDTRLEVQFFVALNDRLLDTLLIWKDKCEHLLHSFLTKCEAIFVEERKSSDSLTGIKLRLRWKHHYEQGTCKF